jgi:hypothetical protein
MGSIQGGVRRPGLTLHQSPRTSRCLPCNRGQGASKTSCRAGQPGVKHLPVVWVGRGNRSLTGLAQHPHRIPVEFEADARFVPGSKEQSWREATLTGSR